MLQFVCVRFSFLWSPYGIGQTIIFLLCGFFYLLFFLRLISAVAGWMSTCLTAISPGACPYNTVNFGPLAAEIGSLVWGTPANFNGFRVFGSVTARYSSSGRQPNFAMLNRGRHLYSAGRPSRWAPAHILVQY